MEDESLDEELSPWEAAALGKLLEEERPEWDFKANTVVYLKGHRGLMDLDLDFPDHLVTEGPDLCYVWKIEEGESLLVHAYVTEDGRRFHLRWPESKTGLLRRKKVGQGPPEHLEGPCKVSGCQVCDAARRLADLMPSRPDAPKFAE